MRNSNSPLIGIKAIPMSGIIYVCRPEPWNVNRDKGQSSRKQRNHGKHKSWQSTWGSESNLYQRPSTPKQSRNRNNNKWVSHPNIQDHTDEKTLSCRCGYGHVQWTCKATPKEVQNYHKERRDETNLIDTNTNEFFETPILWLKWNNRAIVQLMDYVFFFFIWFMLSHLNKTFGLWFVYHKHVSRYNLNLFPYEIILYLWLTLHYFYVYACILG